MFEGSRTEGERAETVRKKRKWYKNEGKYDSVMFVQPTQNSELKKRIQVIAKKNGVKIKVVEKGSGGRNCKMDLDVKVIDSSFGRPSRRMIAESVMIEQLSEEEAMNNKREWTYTKLNKVHVI